MKTISWRGFDDVADWEYTYGRGSSRLHAVNRGIVTGGRGYALNFQARDKQWAGSAPLLRQLLESFRPAP